MTSQAATGGRTAGAAAAPRTSDAIRRAVRRRSRRSKRDVWAAVDRAINPAFFVPKLVEGSEIRVLRRRSGERYAMVKTPRGPSYLRLSEDELATIELMDGKRSVSQLVVARFQTSGEFELATVVDLVEDMRVGGFLVEEPVSVPDLLQTAKRRKARRRLRRLRAAAAERRIEFRRAHGFFEGLYRYGGRFTFTIAGAGAGIAILATGLIAFLVLVSRGKYALIGDSAAGVVVLYAVDMASTFVHESGHALAVIHARRRVNAAGVMLYLGMPAFYIDTTDMWMAERRQRIVSTIAGPYVEWVLAGLASLLALVLPAGAVTGLLYKYAVLSYITILQNLIPFLRLDGYYTFMDLLDVMNLRERSFEFIRQDLPGKIRRREGLTRREWGFAVYGILAVLFVVLAVVLSTLFWGRIFAHAFRSAFRAGWPSRILIVGLVGLMLAPLLRALVRTGRAAVRRTRLLTATVRRVAQRRWRREAAALISALPLADTLDPESLAQITEAVELRSVPAGGTVIRQGERGSEFFVVRSGALEVVRADDDGSERFIRRLERGRSFGELALLEDAPRSATVRARTQAELFVLRKAAFDAVLATRLEIAGEMRAELVSVAELRSLKPFRALGADQAARLLAGAEWELYGAGQTIVRQGEMGDSFFVIGSGQAVVIQDRRRVRTLGSGDYFGETALLLDVPRTATVRAVTPVRILTLERRAFSKVLARAFRRNTLAPSRELAREWEH